MKNGWRRLAGLGGVLAGVMGMMAFAKKEEEAELSEKEADVSGGERSSTFATLSASVSNVGGGGIGLYSKVSLYEDVAWIDLTLTLQRRYDEGTSLGWADEAVIPLSATDTHSLTYSDTLYGYPVNCRYRLRAEAEIPGESKVTMSNGVMITDP